MKTLLALAPFVLLSPFVVSSLGAPHAASAGATRVQDKGLEERVAALETELAAERKKNEETRALLEQSIAYLDVQAQSAKTMLTTLDDVEREGFTPGINFRSREILLAGMRAVWGSTQQGVPKLPGAAKGKNAPPAKAPRQ